MPDKILTSFVWKYLERSGMQAAQFAASIVLARLLAPDDFGLIVLVMSFVAIADVITQSGMKSGLIQRKDAGPLDFTTAFWLAMASAAAFYAVLFFAAPPLAKFYGNESLAPVIRTLGITLFFGAFISVQEAYIEKHFLFRKIFFRSMVGIIPSGIIGIVLAYLGYGMWALVWQYLSSAFLMSMFMLFVIPWRPTLAFSAASAKGLFNYGYKIQLTSLLITGYNSINNLFIGKFFSAAALGFYTRGQYIPHFLVKNVTESVNSVLFPALSNVQDDMERFRRRIAMSLKCSCFIIFPLMAILASAAVPTVTVLLSEKWLPSVVFLQTFCFIFALSPFLSINSIALNSLGRSDLSMKVEIVKKVIELSAFVIALFVFKTLTAVVIGYAVTVPINMYINSFPNKRLLDYGFTRQVRDILPSFAGALACGAAVFPISRLEIPAFAMLALQIPLGFALYVFLARAFKSESYGYIYNMYKEAAKRS